MDWFKMYSEARCDAKLRTLSDSEFRIWFNLMCFANDQKPRGTIAVEDWDLLALEVSNCDLDILNITLKKLEKLRVTRVTEKSVVFVHWETRQKRKPSDDPEAVNQRMKAYRSRSKEAKNTDVTRNSVQLRVTDRNVTPLEENRIESKDSNVNGVAPSARTKKSATTYTPLFEKFYLDEYPKHVGKVEGQLAWNSLGLDNNANLLRKIVVAVRKQKVAWADRDPKHILNIASYLNGRRWEDELEAETPVNGSGARPMESEGLRLARLKGSPV